MSLFAQLTAYLQFYFGATTKYRIHSPFVVDFVENIFEDKRQYYAFEQLELLRQSLLANKQQIEVTDFGAGSRTGQGAQRSIQQIARTALSPRFSSTLLFRLINHYQPQTMLEMGTSLGLTTLYQQAAARRANFITLEGCPQIAQVAQNQFRAQDANNIQSIVGEFSETLPSALKQLKRLDYAFIDGNHRLAPTLDYFEQCLTYTHEESIIVLDDIYWSREMQEAWIRIKQHPKVTLSIDLYRIGIVLFRKAHSEPQHLKLVKWWMKPWIMGFLK